MCHCPPAQRMTTHFSRAIPKLTLQHMLQSSQGTSVCTAAELMR